MAWIWRYVFMIPSSLFHQNRVCFCVFGLTVSKSLTSNERIPDLKKPVHHI